MCSYESRLYMGSDKRAAITYADVLVAADEQERLNAERGAARFDAWFGNYLSGERDQLVDLILQAGNGGRVRGWNSASQRVRMGALCFLTWETVVSVEQIAQLWAGDKGVGVREKVFVLWGAFRDEPSGRCMALWEHLAPTLTRCAYCDAMRNTCFCGDGCKSDLGTGEAPVWPYGCKVKSHA
jgi:hypothetical protein